MSASCAACHTTHALVEPVAKGLSLQATQARDTLQAQVQAVGEGDSAQALVGPETKVQ